MSTELYYNEALLLSGQPVPFVGKEDTAVRYGERWAVKSKISLKGQITGCLYPDLINAQNQLIRNLSKDFQSFKIVEDGISIYTKPYSVVKGINFNASTYGYMLDYDIDIECYEENLFSGVFGVLDPTDRWEFEETEDGLVNITHTIGARGFNTSSGASNAFSNAKNFVHSRTGLSSMIEPYFTYSGSDFHPCLKTLAERPDRFNGNYSITETYVADKYFGTDGILRYTTDFSCNQDGISRVTVQGNVDGCGMYSDIATIRSRYSSLNLHTLANETYTTSTTGGALNSLALSSGVTEDIYSRRLTFSASFDNTTGSAAFLEYNVNVQSGENGITTVSFDGRIKGRGTSKERWQNVQDYYSTINPFAYANDSYEAFAGTTYPLNQTPTSSGVTYNKFNSEIGLAASWDNTTVVAGFSDLSYTLSFVPSLQKVNFIPLTNDCSVSYYVTDLGFASRASFSVEGQAKLDCSNNLAQGVTAVKALGNQLFGQYCPKERALLEENNISTGNFSNSFRFGWSAESTNKVSNGYKSIDTLEL